MKVVCIIPARYASSRFPGKPLAEINNKPMIWWVYHEAIKVKQFDTVLIATESELVFEYCMRNNMNVRMTSDTHICGTDRVAEVSNTLDADLYVIWMGDEPLIKACDAEKIISLYELDPEAAAYMLYTSFVNPVDVVNTTTIKLVISESDDLIYMSRTPVPYPKACLNYSYYKNMGIYAMTKDVLNFYQHTPAGRNEKIEEIELLRLIENHKKIKAMYVDSSSFSIDTPKDLEKAKKIIESKNE